MHKHNISLEEAHFTFALHWKLNRGKHSVPFPQQKRRNLSMGDQVLIREAEPLHLQLWRCIATLHWRRRAKPEPQTAPTVADEATLDKVA